MAAADLRLDLVQLPPFRIYRRAGTMPLRPYVPGEDLSRVSITDDDRVLGSPKEGDMIAQHPERPDDQWLIEASKFAASYDPNPID